MPSMTADQWHGVFPAITTPFTPEGDVTTVDMTDLLATAYVGFAGTAGGVDRPITQGQFDKVTLTTP